MSAHTAEVLRQADGAALEEDGWVGGDAWFGSVMSAVELRTRLNVHSTFIIKQHTNYYPMQVLARILKARHGDRPAGHWVTMRAVISGVPLTAIAYAWSNKDVAYMVSTMGNTNSGPQNYICFDTNTGYDNNDTKQYPCPHIVDFLF